MNLFRSIFFLCASSVLLLHSLVPHEELELVESKNSVGHQEPISLLDHIALTFHLYQAAGHLEDFNLESASAQITQEQAAILAVVLLDFKCPYVEVACVCTSKQSHAFKSLNVSGFSHRGPPIA